MSSSLLVPVLAVIALLVALLLFSPVQLPGILDGPTPADGAKAPQAIRDVPADLSAPGLRASGLDSDGWLAAGSSFTLAQPGPPAAFVVRGMVPLIGDAGFTTELRVAVDGAEVARQTLGLGDFELRAPASTGGAGNRRIELSFSASQVLPAPDTRQVGARVSYLGFEGN